MNLEPVLIDAMFARHGVSGQWEPLPSIGLANVIYATRDVVLRVATDHPDGFVDARTESVAAPIARAAGILTPRLIAFDDTRTLVERPFSLWDRVHGETVGLANLPPFQEADVWREVGRELARLHLRVRECPDPAGYLDDPGREQDFDAVLKPLVDAKRIDPDTARRIDDLAAGIRPHLDEPGDVRFIHNDVHAMNVMCSTTGVLLAIIDWGDAGWGDPALDFAAIPLEAMPFAWAGYDAEAPGLLGRFPEARFVWDKLLGAMDDLWDTPARSLDLEAVERLVRSGIARPNDMPTPATFNGGRWASGATAAVVARRHGRVLGPSGSGPDHQRFTTLIVTVRRPPCPEHVRTRSPCLLRSTASLVRAWSGTRPSLRSLR